MTRGQLIARVTSNLNDAGITYYQAIDYQDSLQDAYDDIARETHCIEKRTNINSVSGLTYYDFPSLISDFVDIRAIYNSGINLWLDPMTLIELKATRYDWEKAYAQPTNFSVVSFRYIILWPTYLGPAQAYTVFYAAAAPTFTSDSDIPLIPNNFVRVLEDYCTADLLEQAQENSKAARYWMAYEQKKTALRRFVQERMLTDRVMSLSEPL